MLKEYSIQDIIVTNPAEKFYYVGTFEDTENPDVDWPHRHDFYSLVWFTESKGINVIDFEEYEIRPNRIFFMQPQQVHNWSYSKNSKGYILVFAKHFIGDYPLHSVNVPFLDLSPQKSTFLKQIVESLIEESNQNDRLGEELAVSGITFLLLSLTRLAKNTGNDTTKPKSMLAFAQLITDTISENLSIKEYANRLHITPEKLNEICKAYYGQNPKTIILDKKITEAKRLLYFTDFSVKEIAYQLGFEDSSYFSRIFKRKTKCSPSNFKSA